MAPPLKKQKQESRKDIRASSKGLNLKAVEQEALDLAKRDPIRLDTQIRSSISLLSVAGKSAAEVLKVAAADRAEYDAEKASLVEQLKERTALCEQLQKGKASWSEQLEREKAEQKEQLKAKAVDMKKEVEADAKKTFDKVLLDRNNLVGAFYYWGLTRDDVALAFAKKYSEIIFLDNDASPVADHPFEQTPALEADDTTKEEVVRLRGKVIEMEKALSRARDSITRTQQVHNKLEYERHLDKSNFDNTFKELFELQCRYGKIKIERDEVLRKESDRFALLQKSLKDKQFVDESDKLECQSSSEILGARARNRHSIEAQRCSAPAGVSIIWGGVDRRIQAQLEINQRHACDELERCKGHNACLEREKVECNKLLQSSDKRVTLLEARLLDAQKRLQMSKSCLKKYLTPKRGKRASNTDHECQIADVIAFYGGELERVENEFRRYITSCGKDVEVENDKVKNMWFAKGNEGGEASTSKPRAEESEKEEVEDLLPHTRHKTRPQEVVIFNEPLQVDAGNSKAEANEQDELTVLSTSNKELSAMLQQCSLAVKNTTLANSKLESDMLELQSRLNVVTVALSFKDA
ncbi:hypothetical protein GIB67_003402 [Kingdonia uniflora]|uniref:Uncharacterized protein n=1 Tax=Kingdonia uniflora TaxID=39325 RepID=A0A7J7P9U4_9MAGN|nr:hypothetical protein GIB67_003402 [Kingdonia uniflora]